jgi:hypothetical protein
MANYINLHLELSIQFSTSHNSSSDIKKEISVEDGFSIGKSDTGQSEYCLLINNTL